MSIKALLFFILYFALVFLPCGCWGYSFTKNVERYGRLLPSCCSSLSQFHKRMIERRLNGRTFLLEKSISWNEKKMEGATDLEERLNGVADINKVELEDLEVWEIAKLKDRQRKQNGSRNENKKFLERGICTYPMANHDQQIVNEETVEIGLKSISSQLQTHNTRRTRLGHTRIKLGGQDNVLPPFIQVSPSQIEVCFGDHTVITNATFHISSGDRIGLVGPNGAGKSTLLKVIYGELAANRGEILTIPANSDAIRFAFLRQEFIESLQANRSLREEVFSAFADENRVLSELKQLQEQIQSCTSQIKVPAENSFNLEDLLQRLEIVQEEAIAIDAFNIDSRLQKVLSLMGFSAEDENALVGSFSGGWKMRIGLAKLFCNDPNILLLDEPTNHMDLDSVIWLEGFLKNQNIPMLIVSHDREFLDQVCNRIVEIEDGVTISYGSSSVASSASVSPNTGTNNHCNYSRYLTLKANRIQEWKDQYDKQQKYIQDEERWIKKAKNDVITSHLVKSREAMLLKYKNSPSFLSSPPPKDRRFRFRFPTPPRSSELVLEAFGLGHGYGTSRYETLFENIDFSIHRGARVGFVGPNGSGKSTLLRLLAGLEEPKEGFVQLGSSNIHINYYAQDQADSLDLEDSVLQSVSSVVPSFQEFSMTEVRNLLAQFMFKGDQVDKQIKVLSGGEKSRVALCRMMLRPANLLLLDEPTNHLDIVAKEVLEDAIIHFPGTVLLVSHDRYFMSQTVNAIFEFGNKSIERHDCDYHDYLSKIGGSLKDRVASRHVDGDKYRISNAKPIVARFDDDRNRKKNFGGSGISSGNRFKGIKNAKRFS